MKTSLARAIGALAVVLFPILARAQFAITPLVTTSTHVPGGTGNFKAFTAQDGSDPVAPSLDGTSMVFTGIDANGNGGIYRWDNGVFSLVVNRSTPIPNQSATFDVPGFGAISGQQVAFNAHTPTGNGIYLANGSQILTIADASAGFSGFGRPSIADGEIAFLGEAGPGQQIYRYRNGVVSQIAGGFQSVGNAHIGHGGNVAFEAHGSGQQRGIYMVNSANAFSIIADTNTLMPGGTVKFDYFNSTVTSVDGSDVAFAGGSATQSGVWARINGTLRSIAVNGQAAASGQTISFDPANEPEFSLDGQHLAFMDRTGTVFTDYRNKLERVVGIGDLLNSKRIDRIELSPDALSGSLLVFNAHFSDGSTAIYAARVPEPFSASVMLPFLLVMRRRRRS